MAEQMAGKMGTGAQKIGEGAREIKDAAVTATKEAWQTGNDAVKEYADVAKEKAKEYADVAKDKAKEYSEAATEFVKENPMMTLAIAFGVGAMMGMLLSRSRD